MEQFEFQFEFLWNLTILSNRTFSCAEGLYQFYRCYSNSSPCSHLAV